MIFKDRRDAGRKLTKKLLSFKNKPNTIVIGLPRGGVITAHIIAKALKLPLDIIVVRKIGATFESELAIGALTEECEPILDQQLIESLNIKNSYIKEQIILEKKEAERRYKLYRGNRLPLDLKNKTAILTDDGIATGATMRAAIVSAKAKGASKIIVAVPVIASDIVDTVGGEVDELIYLDAPLLFDAVGAFYEEFEQTTDKEVIEIMKENG